MTLATTESFVELRFRVPSGSLEAACKAIAPYVTDRPLAAPPFTGVTQKEIDMLLKDYRPSVPTRR